jgi:capsular exopolysaccharide synthesis family protein
MAQLDKKVLLVDCDMRRPSLNIKLGLKKIPGLSNYLTRQVQEKEAIQKYGNEDGAFDVICAGRNPPNPIELLSSKRMKSVLDEFRQQYDYIILDLPPVEEVSDALVTSKLVDGTLLVVRQNYCNTHALSSAVKQFNFVGTRILGVVLNCSSDKGVRYYKNRYRGYKYRYEGSYSRIAKQDGKS